MVLELNTLSLGFVQPATLATEPAHLNADFFSQSL